MKGLAARRKTALAIASIATLGLLMFAGTGTAVAADRMVIAENFTGTW